MKQIKKAVEYIQSVYDEQPKVGIVLGSGLGSFTKEIKIEKEIAYADIPHFPESTVEGHSGKLILGELSGKKVVAMSGRFHYYEGYSAEEIVFPIRAIGCSQIAPAGFPGATTETRTPHRRVLCYTCWVLPPSIRPDGGCSSKVEHRTVAPDAAGSSPVIHPNLRSLALPLGASYGWQAWKVVRRSAKPERNEGARLPPEGGSYGHARTCSFRL